MEMRDRLIEAAARVYAAAGFRGATTRRIAEEAGVNEVTIFRLFGCKATLLDEAVRHSAATLPEEVILLPDEPDEPQRELTAWCEAQLTMLRGRRAMFRKTMSEVEERPEMGPCAVAAPAGAGAELKRYMQRLYERGMAGAGSRRAGRNEEAHAAGAMLMSALLGDAMLRDVMPDLFPQPAERAAGLYVRVFLRGIALRARGEWKAPPRAAGSSVTKQARGKGSTREANTKAAGTT